MLLILLSISLISNTTSQTCDAGKEWSGTSCEDCSDGKYQEQNDVSMNVNTNTIPMQEQIFQSKLEEMERERSILMKQMNM